MAVEFTPRHAADSESGSDQSNSEGSVWTDSSDKSSDVTELDQDEFPAYFETRNGRLFPSRDNSSYPLPVDAEEQRVCGEVFMVS